MITRRSVWIVTLKILTDAFHQSVYSENPNGYDKKILLFRFAKIIQLFFSSPSVHTSAYS